MHLGKTHKAEYIPLFLMHLFVRVYMPGHSFHRRIKNTFFVMNTFEFTNKDIHYVPACCMAKCTEFPGSV